MSVVLILLLSIQYITACSGGISDGYTSGVFNEARLRSNKDGIIGNNITDNESVNSTAKYILDRIVENNENDTQFSNSTHCTITDALNLTLSDENGTAVYLSTVKDGNNISHNDTQSGILEDTFDIIEQEYIGGEKLNQNKTTSINKTIWIQRESITTKPNVLNLFAASQPTEDTNLSISNTQYKNNKSSDEEEYYKSSDQVNRTKRETQDKYDAKVNTKNVVSTQRLKQPVEDQQKASNMYKLPTDWGSLPIEDREYTEEDISVGVHKLDGTSARVSHDDFSKKKQSKGQPKDKQGSQYGISVHQVLESIPWWKGLDKTSVLNKWNNKAELFRKAIHSQGINPQPTCLLEWEECHNDKECCSPFFCSTLPKIPSTDEINETTLEIGQFCSRFLVKDLKERNDVHDIIDFYKGKMLEVINSYK